MPVDVDEMEAVARAVQCAHGSVWMVSATGEAGEYRVWRVGRLPSTPTTDDERADDLSEEVARLRQQLECEIARTAQLLELRNKEYQRAERLASRLCAVDGNRERVVAWALDQCMAPGDYGRAAWDVLAILRDLPDNNADWEGDE